GTYLFGGDQVPVLAAGKVFQQHFEAVGQPVRGRDTVEPVDGELPVPGRPHVAGPETVAAHHCGPSPEPMCTSARSIVWSAGVMSSHIARSTFPKASRTLVARTRRCARIGVVANGCSDSVM